MAAYLGLVARAAQRHARIFAPQAGSYAARNRGFAHTRRAYKADDLPLYIRRQLAHCQNLQNAFLHFFQAIVLFVQKLLRLADIQVIFCFGLPGQFEASVQISADYRRLLCIARHFGKALYFLQKLFLCVLGHAAALNFFRIYLSVFAGILIIVQFTGNSAHLLAQIVIALVFVHLLVYFVLDVLFNAKHLHLAFEHIQNLFQTPQHCALVKKSLLFRIFQKKVGGDVVAQKSGVFTAQDGKHHILGKTRREGQIFFKCLLDAAQQRLCPRGLRRFYTAQRRGFCGCKQKTAAGIQRKQLSAVFALYQHLDQFVGDTQHLLHFRHNAVVRKVFERRVLCVDILLCSEKHCIAVADGPFYRGDRFLSAHFKMDDIARKYHQPAQRYGRQAKDIGIFI